MIDRKRARLPLQGTKVLDLSRLIPGCFCKAMLADLGAEVTKDEWMDEFGGLNICVGPVNTIQEALSHPQTFFRGMVQEVEHPAGGRVRQLGSPLKLSEIPVDVGRLPTPQLGQHTKEILSGPGYSEQEVEDLFERKIVGVLEQQ